VDPAGLLVLFMPISSEVVAQPRDLGSSPQSPARNDAVGIGTVRLETEARSTAPTKSLARLPLCLRDTPLTSPKIRGAPACDTVLHSAECPGRVKRASGASHCPVEL
jgi:hypothetical protein